MATGYGSTTSVWRHWLVLVGVVFYHGLYFLLQRHVVRKLCDPILRKQASLHGKPAADDHLPYSNGAIANGTGGEVNYGARESEQKRVLSEGDVADIAGK